MKRLIKVGVLLVALVVMVLAGWLVWGSWTSPIERRAMRVALDRIEEVARYKGSEQNVYDQKVQAAHEAILVCQKRRITAYAGSSSSKG
jgi:uncharacterized membrane protein YccC